MTEFIKLGSIMLGSLIVIIVSVFMHGLGFAAYGLASAMLFGTNVNLWAFFWVGIAYALLKATVSLSTKRKDTAK